MILYVWHNPKTGEVAMYSDSKGSVCNSPNLIMEEIKATDEQYGQLSQNYRPKISDGELVLEKSSRIIFEEKEQAKAAEIETLKAKINTDAQTKEGVEITDIVNLLNQITV